MISNSTWQDRNHQLEPATPPQLHATNVACRGWEVEAEHTFLDKGPDWEHRTVVKTKATFELDRSPGSARYHIEFYDVTKGTATWVHTGYVGSSDGSYDVYNPDVHYTMMMETYGVPYGIVTIAPAGPGTRRYTVTAAKPGSDTFDIATYTCPNGDTFKEPVNNELWLATTAAGPTQVLQSIANDGRTLEGKTSWTNTPQVGTVTHSYEWKMTALPPE